MTSEIAKVDLITLNRKILSIGGVRRYQLRRLKLIVLSTITASRTSPAGKRSPNGEMRKEVEKRDREGRQETVSRKLVWLFVIWNLEFGILLI